MKSIEKDDGEMSYRRGFEHGALETFHAVERFLDPAMREAVRAWIEQDIHGWRLKGYTRSSPTWRLANLSVLKSN
jgi:predicted N-acyltransferase